jgi:hypothetical protein
MRTWMLELGVVAAILAAVCATTRGGAIEAVGALAVIAAFAHAQVAERMREKEAARAVPDVHCHGWLTRYFFVKELLWLSYFIAHRSWSALVGVGVFLLYPLWRKWWRARRPAERMADSELRQRFLDRVIFSTPTPAYIEHAVLSALRPILPLGIYVEVLPTKRVSDLGPGQLQIQLIEGGGDHV